MLTDSFDFNVINLERRRDRKERFLEINGKVCGLRFGFVSAVDAQRLDRTKIRQLGLMAGDSDFAPGFLACALSHRQLYLQAVAAQLPILICEDDAVFRNDFASRWDSLLKHLPANWDLVLFGYNFDSALAVEIVPGVQQMHGHFNNRPIEVGEIAAFQQISQPVILVKLLNAFGSLAYALSPSGAAKILRDCFPLRPDVVTVGGLGRSFPAFSLDCLMNRYYPSWNAFAVFPPLAISPNDKSTSDTSSSSTYLNNEAQK